VDYYRESSKTVLQELDTTFSGLQSSEAAARLEKYGKNKLKEAKKVTLAEKFLKQLADPMIIILIVAAIISGVTAAYSGESFADVIIIGAVVIINAVLGVFQESKAEKAIEALQEMTAATSKVMRDGRIQSIRSEELVPGDVVILEAGDAVPADARIIECASIKAEESALTGESVPVTKQEEPLEGGDISLGDRKNMVYMGSTVVYGRGRAVITGTGMETEMGKIAGVLADAKEEKTPLQRKLGQLSTILSYIVIGICVFIFALSLIRTGDFSGAAMLDTFMVAVSLAVAAIPEGLATVVTIVLSMGVTKMSKRNAVIRKLTAVETLGCARIICSDKTGTLTQNKMTVTEHFGNDEQYLGTAMSLCSDAEPGENGKAQGEPTECALVDYAASIGLDKPGLKLRYPRVGEAPFDSSRKMMSTLHEGPYGLVQFTKGAPDEVLKRCTGYLAEDGQVRDLTDEVKAGILKANKDMADKALRVLCAAFRTWKNMPATFQPEELERDLVFIGLTGMIDPVRPEVKAAVDECRSAGIKVVMITGDHKDTAVAIAKELGILEDASAAVTGAELNNMSDEELVARIRDISVCARVQPEHKVRIVKAWRSLDCITAMTGDGVNDAPSIKTADIGVGMGITGTDVTKNVADMVLADDNFATIVGAVEEGRRIYDNIRKAIQFLLGSNMSEVLSIFTATLLGFTILKPVHLLWINLITDCFPALALGVEKAEPGLMKRKPRDSRDGIFAGGLGVDVAYQGVMVTILTLASYFIGHFIESGVWEIAESPDGMTMAFLTMSMAEIFHSINMRSQRGSIFTLHSQNLMLLGAAGTSLVLTTAVIYIDFLSNAFGFTHISAVEYFVAMALAATTIPIVECVKFIQRKLAKK